MCVRVGYVMWFELVKKKIYTQYNNVLNYMLHCFQLLSRLIYQSTDIYQDSNKHIFQFATLLLTSNQLSLYADTDTLIWSWIIIPNTWKI